MAVTIIIRDSAPRGDTRSALDKKLQDAGWGSSFKDEAALDKCKFVERKLKRNLGVENAIPPAAVYNRMGRKHK